MIFLYWLVTFLSFFVAKRLQKRSYCTLRRSENNRLFTFVKWTAFSLSLLTLAHLVVSAFFGITFIGYYTDWKLYLLTLFFVDLFFISFHVNDISLSSFPVAFFNRRINFIRLGKWYRVIRVTYNYFTVTRVVFGVIVAFFWSGFGANGAGITELGYRGLILPREDVLDRERDFTAFDKVILNANTYSFKIKNPLRVYKKTLVFKKYIGVTNYKVSGRFNVVPPKEISEDTLKAYGDPIIIVKNHDKYEVYGFCCFPYWGHTPEFSFKNI